jgi:hypothetical protein
MPQKTGFRILIPGFQKNTIFDVAAVLSNNILIDLLLLFLFCDEIIK